MGELGAGEEPFSTKQLPVTNPSEEGEEAPPAASEGNWIDRIAELWSEHHGLVTRDVLERELAPGLGRHTPDEIVAAAHAYLLYADDRPQFKTPRALASQLVSWVADAKTYFRAPAATQAATGSNGTRSQDEDFAVVEPEPPSDHGPGQSEPEGPEIDEQAAAGPTPAWSAMKQQLAESGLKGGPS